MRGYSADSRSVRSSVGDLGFRTEVRPEIRGRRRSRRKAQTFVVTVCALLLGAVGLATLDPAGDGYEESTKARASYLVHETIIIFGDSEFSPSNGVTGGTGTPSDPYIIEGWEINGTESGICIYIAYTTAHYVIRGVHCHGNQTYAVMMLAASNGTVEDCLIEGRGGGIMVMGCMNCSVIANDFRDLGFGVMVWVCGNSTVSGNTILNASFAGIYALEGNNITIESNTCSETMIGIVAAGMDEQMIRYCRIANNTVADTDLVGVWVNSSEEVTIEGNEIARNAEYGMILGNSTDVRVFHNSFIDNGVQAWHDNCTVTWDDGYPSGGNYWSDYAGSDHFSGPDQDLPGEDGIGDAAYVTDSGGVDRYPLMNPDFEPIPELGAALIPVLLVVCALPIAFSRIQRSRRT